VKPAQTRAQKHHSGVATDLPPNIRPAHASDAPDKASTRTITNIADNVLTLTLFMAAPLIFFQLHTQVNFVTAPLEMARAGAILELAE